MASRSCLLSVLFALLFAPAVASHAALITVSSSQGPATAVLDTVSGLEWLKVSVADNLSVLQVEAATAPGGQLQGFRYATREEFECSLMASYFNKPCSDIGGFQVPGDIATVESFFDLFGFEVGHRRSGYFNMLPPEPERVREGFVGTFFFYDEATPHYEYDSQRQNFSNLALNSPAHHWLVSSGQQVSEPSVVLLAGIGAIAFAAASRNRRQRPPKPPITAVPTR